MTEDMIYYLPIIGLSMLAGIPLYFFRNTGYFKFFPPFLLITLLVEYAGWQLAMTGTNNAVIYNMYPVVEVPFCLLVIRSMIRNRNIRIIIIFCICAFLAVKVANYILLAGNMHHLMTYSLGGLFIVVSGCIYFYERFTEPAPRSLFLEPDAWVCFGLSSFFLLVSPVFIFYSVMHNPSETFMDIATWIVIIMNIILYTSILVAIICKYRQLSMRSG
jgi:hypothetical protein